ncbi:MAG: DUF5723 family protein [Bacteroidales bacterium]
MLKILRLVVFSAVLFCVCSHSAAQEMRTAYFLKGYSYRQFMNPAFESERNFFSMPGLGNIAVAGNGNVGLSDFLYRYDDPMQESILTTFMNKSVSADEFLGNLRKNNKVGVQADISLFTLGIRVWGGFNTFHLGLHSRSRVNAPYELFDFMKTGELGSDGPKSYHVENLRMNSLNYVDITWGHSRAINEKLRVGVNLKFLVGAANVETRFRDMRITMGEEEWLIEANGYLNASVKGAYFTSKESGEINKMKVSSPGIGGYGAAIDLGATYNLIPGLTLSASVIDLGFIHWQHTLRGATSNDPYSFKGFEMIGVGSESEFDPIEDQIDQIGDDLKELIKLYDHGTTNSTTGLTATVSVGAEYELPAYRKLSFGLLSTTYIHRPYTRTEFRGSVNVAPLHWFEASASGVVSDYGAGFGFLLNFHPKGFGFFIGTDFMFTEITPQFIPVHNMNASFNMGINFPIGNLN